MMIEEDTAMKAEVLYGAGCNLVSEDQELGTNSSNNNMTIFNAT